MSYRSGVSVRHQPAHPDTLAGVAAAHVGPGGRRHAVSGGRLDCPTGHLPSGAQRSGPVRHSAATLGCKRSDGTRVVDRPASGLTNLRELPSAPTWSFPPRSWTSRVQWIPPSANDSRLLVGTRPGGRIRSDGGETWDDHRPGPQHDVHAPARHQRARGQAYKACRAGASFGLDVGGTRHPAVGGRDRHYTWGLAVDPVDLDCWDVSAAGGPRQAHAPVPGCGHLAHRQSRLALATVGRPWQDPLVDRAASGDRRTANRYHV